MKKTLIIILSTALFAVFVGFVLYLANDPEYIELSDDIRSKSLTTFIKLSQGYTEYEYVNDTATTLVVLVHGFSVPMYIWDKTRDFLVDQGFGVLRYSTLGRGLTDRIEGNYDNLAFRTQLHDLVTALNIRKPFHIAGLSFGGPITTDFVIHYPEMIDKVIFVDPGYSSNNPPASEFLMDFTMALDETKRAEGQLFDFKYPANYPKWPDLYRETMFYNGHRNALISTIHHYKNIKENYSKLNQFNKDVLLIWGVDDPVVPFQFADSLKPRLHLTLKPIPDTAHLPHIEKADTVNSIILGFLSK